MDRRPIDPDTASVEELADWHLAHVGDGQADECVSVDELRGLVRSCMTAAEFECIHGVTMGEPCVDCLFDHPGD